MKTIKQIFPLSFKYDKSIKDLIIGLIIYIVVGAIFGVVIGIVASIPVVNLVCGILGTLVEIYVLAGVVLQVLSYLKIVK